ncbi:HD domain-containing protein [Desulfococcaceae bacterium HSG8]|nr:HD domain-containing protein [Desulfococcaceae bacterium HSG8]
MSLSSVKLFDLVNSLSIAVDLMSEAVVNHHNRVTYIAASIASEMELEAKTQRNLILAGLLHDIGAFSLKTRSELLHFEFVNPNEHAESGFHLLKNLIGFSDAAEFVRYHHVPFDKIESIETEKISEPCQILYLADRLDTLIHHDEPILLQVDRICEKIREETGKKFSPHIVGCFLELASSECFWMDLVSSFINHILKEQFQTPDMVLNLDEMISFSRVFSQIIDFKSRFTATHSSGVSYTAGSLGKIIGFDDEKCRMLRLASDLHDLGKLAVPSEILEKPETLTDEDYCIIKPHPYYTYRILQSVEGFDEIAEWAGFHHERLDGRGYPFHLEGERISQEARIIAVADVFTAITEDRPYRKGMSEDMAKDVLHNFASVSALDDDIISMLLSNYSEIDEGRRDFQAKAFRSYEEFGGDA